jgi:hypothetical protein
MPEMQGWVWNLTKTGDGDILVCKSNLIKKGDDNKLAAGFIDVKIVSGGKSRVCVSARTKK